MQNQILEVIKWYEESLGRKITQSERACIRYQCAIAKSRMPETKELKQFGIYIDGLEYGGKEKPFKEIPKEKIKHFGENDGKPIETSPYVNEIIACSEEDGKILDRFYSILESEEEYRVGE